MEFLTLYIQHNSRICVQTSVDKITPIYLVVSIFVSADWGEREFWNMFGVFLNNMIYAI
jgi:NADH:ubiquinone oxidoreductase subunit C